MTMIDLLLKTTVFDYCIDVIFNKVASNFTQVDKTLLEKFQHMLPGFDVEKLFNNEFGLVYLVTNYNVNSLDFMHSILTEEITQYIVDTHNREMLGEILGCKI